MIKGDTDLSRARGTKAQQRRNSNNHSQNNFSNAKPAVFPENTIDFQAHARVQRRAIELVPKSLAQEQLILDLLNPDLAVTVVLGPAGTGKSYLAMLAALRDLRQGRVQRIVLTRPAVGVDDEQHGFLPGDLNRKMEPWARPLLDIIRDFYGTREMQRMIDDQIIEISPLAFMRGRTFRDAWIVADEMQNATPNQMKMLLTRIGSGSRIVVTGDIEQTDRDRRENGLLDLMQRLQQHDPDGMSLRIMTLRDVQRHPIIESVLEMYA